MHRYINLQIYKLYNIWDFEKIAFATFCNYELLIDKIGHFLN